MTALIVRQSPDLRTPEPKTTRFAQRRAEAAAKADVSVCENQALSRAASEALAANRRRDSSRTPS